MGWMPLGILSDYDREIAGAEIGQLSEPIRNRDKQDELLIFMVAETDEFRDIRPDHLEQLKTNALDNWINENRRDHEVYAVFNSDIYNWIIEQLGVSSSITPTPAPDDPLERLFQEQGLVSRP